MDCARVVIVLVALGLVPTSAASTTRATRRARPTNAPAPVGVLVPGRQLRPPRVRRGLPLRPPRPGHDAPADYTRPPWTTSTRPYADLAPEDADRVPRRADDANVVVVLSEAFTDPTPIEGPDALPRTRSRSIRVPDAAHPLRRRCSPSSFGGGTANMEFETLTGTSPLAVPPADEHAVPDARSPTPRATPRWWATSAATGTAGRGAPLHDHDVQARTRSTRRWGSRASSTTRTMASTAQIDDDAFISDTSAFDEVLRPARTTDEPALVNLVTMQNHYPMDGQYDDPIAGRASRRRGRPALRLPPRPQHTDDARQELPRPEALRRERTAVVFYGDHRPASGTGTTIRTERRDAAFRQRRTSCGATSGGVAGARGRLTARSTSCRRCSTSSTRPSRRTTSCCTGSTSRSPRWSRVSTTCRTVGRSRRTSSRREAARAPGRLPAGAVRLRDRAQVRRRVDVPAGEVARLSPSWSRPPRARRARSRRRGRTSGTSRSPQPRR